MTVPIHILNEVKKDVADFFFKSTLSEELAVNFRKYINNNSKLPITAELIITSDDAKYVETSIFSHIFNLSPDDIEISLKNRIAFHFKDNKIATHNKLIFGKFLVFDK